ncbi:MAG: hypothetical protein IJH34_06955 [Romboutsia sp.]|nr:hypothetical protein [Romboutsia sp.]
MLTQFELKILNNLKCIISILESNSFLKFFREVIFLSAYHKSCVNEEVTLYYYIEYIDDRCDIVTTNKKKLQ